jgi:hypothetical protein
MKQIIIILSLSTLLVACGKSSSSGAKDGQIKSPVIAQVELSLEEIKLKEKLLEMRVIQQKDLMKELLEFKELTKTTLNNLDQFINVECAKASGLCYITNKE